MARNMYQYETSPRKLEPDYSPNKKRKQLEVKTTNPNKKQKQNKKLKNKKVRQTLTVLALFAVLLAISYRNSQINESFSEVQNLKTELASIQKENEQLEVNIENSLNLQNIEQAAKEKLGMQKLTNKQTAYIELPKKDYVQSASEEVVIEESGNWFTNLINKILGK